MVVRGTRKHARKRPKVKSFVKEEGWRPKGASIKQYESAIVDEQCNSALTSE